MDTLAKEKIKLDNFYREQRNTRYNPQPVTVIDHGEDDDSGDDLYQGREDAERIIGSHE